MSIMLTAASSSANTTIQKLGWFPMDVDDQFLFLVRDINFAIVTFAIVLCFLVVISSLKRLSELARSSTVSAQRNPNKESWVVHKLKSKYAGPCVICAAAVQLLFGGVMVVLLYFDIGRKAGCEIAARMLTFNYIMSIWTTYVIFEIRRIATGSENLKGMRYVIMQFVRFSTLGGPPFAIVAYFSTANIYLADVRHCISVVDPAATAILGVADGMLSAGHIMLFIFAIRRKSNVQIALVGTRNRVKSSTASSPQTKSNNVLMNRDLASPQDDATNKIQSIARRNLRLALVTVASTAVAMVILSWVNLASPPIDSPTARSYLYLRHFGLLTSSVDLIVNLACLKKISTKITATVAARKIEEESDVSTLGGGD